MLQIAFFDAKEYDRQSFEAANVSGEFSIRFLETRLTPDTYKLAEGCDVVCVFVNDEINSFVIDMLCSMGIRLIALRCAGYNNVDVEYAYGKIHVVRVPAYSPYAVAEHAMAMLLTSIRRIHKAYIRTKDFNFSLEGMTGFDLHGKTVGVIGTGKIARVLIGILKGFGINVLAYDIFEDKEYEKAAGIKYVTLDELYAKSDIISLNCPLTPENRYLINKDSIAKMKDGVMLINTGRGPLINTEALVEGLKSGKIGAAGLDVYEEESQYFFQDKSDNIIADDKLGRLLSFNNVLLTSHQAFFTKEAMHNIVDTTLANAKAYFEGKELVNEVKAK